MITVHHESWVATLEISFPETWQKIRFFSVGKKSFLGGMSKWLQYYIGVVRQMITVLHKGWSDKWSRYTMNLGLLHEEYHFHRLDKKSDFFQLVKNHFWRVCQNDYNFTWGVLDRVSKAENSYNSRCEGIYLRLKTFFNTHCSLLGNILTIGRHYEQIYEDLRYKLFPYVSTV